MVYPTPLEELKLQGVSEQIPPGEMVDLGTVAIVAVIIMAAVVAVATTEEGVVDLYLNVLQVVLEVLRISQDTKDVKQSQKALLRTIFSMKKTHSITPECHFILQ